MSMDGICFKSISVEISRRLKNSICIKCIIFKYLLDKQLLTV